MNIKIAEIRRDFRSVAERLPGESTFLMLTAFQSGGAGRVSRRSKVAARKRASLEAEKIEALASIFPSFTGRPRSAIRQRLLESRIVCELLEQLRVIRHESMSSNSFFSRVSQRYQPWKAGFCGVFKLEPLSKMGFEVQSMN